MSDELILVGENSQLLRSPVLEFAIRSDESIETCSTEHTTHTFGSFLESQWSFKEMKVSISKYFVSDSLLILKRSIF